MILVLLLLLFTPKTETEIEPLYYNDLYPLTVECVDYNGNTATCIDNRGYLWSFTSDDAEVGDYYSFIMDSNGTWDVIKDDAIKCVRYYK